MYKITVLSSGKYGNCSLGARYCLTRKLAFETAKIFYEVDCKFTIEKFTRINFGVYTWSDSEVLGKFYDFLAKTEKEKMGNG